MTLCCCCRTCFFIGRSTLLIQCLPMFGFFRFLGRKTVMSGMRMNSGSDLTSAKIVDYQCSERGGALPCSL